MKSFIAELKEMFPEASDSDFEVLVWNVTGFPFVKDEEALRQLQEAIDASDGTVDGVIAYAETEIEKEWDKVKEDYARELEKENWIDITKDCRIDNPQEWGAEGIYGFIVYYNENVVIQFSDEWEDVKDGYRILINPDGYFGFRIEKRI